MFVRRATSAYTPPKLDAEFLLALAQYANKPHMKQWLKGEPLDFLKTHARGRFSAARKLSDHGTCKDIADSAANELLKRYEWRRPLCAAGPGEASYTFDQDIIREEEKKFYAAIVSATRRVCDLL